MEIEEIYIYDFMRAWFNKDYTIISKERFDIAYTEYIDVSGLFSNKEFELVTYIHYLNHRINSVNLSLTLHREYFLFCGEPCIAEFKFLEQFGHYLTWTGDKNAFEKSLNKIEVKEKKYNTIYKQKIKQLQSEREKSISESKKTKGDSRQKFVSMLMSLGKVTGYHIKTKETTVEELAVLIKTQSENNASAV